ncbi:hypothetical protein HDZ31DRAFT_5455, partial [Schizophyllum fasciatum]
MFDILHIARILRVLMDEALDAAPADKAASSSGDAVPTLPREWRCATFDRAAIRMFYAGFLLPRDGYGDTYMADFWEAHEDLRYKQDISECECNWAQFVARWHDGFAPLSKEQHKAFDAASYADCLQWSGDDSDGHPVWDPSAAGEEGYVVTDALYAQSGIPRDTPSTRIVQPSEAPRDVSKTADPPSGEDADLGAGLPPPQLDHAAPAQRPPASGPSGEVDPEAPDSAVATPRTAATSGPESSQTTSTDEIQSNEPEPMRIDEDPAPARPLSGRDGAPTTTNRHVSQPQSTPGAASSRLVSLPQKARPARPPPPIAQSPAPQSGPSSTARIAEQPPIASPLQSPTTAPHRWSSSSRHTPATVAHSDETAHLRLENARLQAELAAQSEYRTLLTAALERERSAAAADRQAALMREAQAAQRELRASEELAQMRAEAARREDDAREREAWWRAASAKWDAERAEYKADVERREEQLARRDRELDEAAAAQAGLRQQFALLQTGMGAGRMIGGPTVMVLNLRKRPWKYLGDDSDDDDDSEPRRVKRELSTSSSLGAVALSEEQPRVQLKPPWYHIDELAFHTAETRPHYTPAFIVNFLKANAVSVAYHRTTGRTAAYHKKYLTLSLPDGRSAMVSAEYRLPVIYLSHFLWSYVWRVIALGDPFEAEMFNLLHLARLLCALAQGAIRAAPQYKLADGGDICAWRCQPFDRALLRMSYDDFLLPIDGYGERYHQAFWKRHQDTKYRPRQEIEHRNWRKVVSSRNGWLAPLRVNDALTPFDAAAVADCLHMGPGGPFWEPTTEAGHAVTKRLHDQYPDVIGGTVHSIAFTKEAPIGV